MAPSGSSQTGSQALVELLAAGQGGSGYGPHGVVDGGCLGQTMESTKWLSGINFLRKAPRVIRLS